jgi:hypothetical protein
MSNPVGLLVEYGAHKREYLANAGFHFTEALGFVGTVGSSGRAQ